MIRLNDKKLKKHYPKLIARQLQWIALGLFKDKITFETRQGVYTASTKDYGLAAHLFRNKQYEYDFSLDVVDFLKSNGYIPHNNIAMADIGANIGVIGIGLLRAGKINSVIAIEPVTQNYEFLIQNIKQNSLSDQVTAIQAAVGNKTETLTMELSENNFGDHRVHNGTRLTTHPNTITVNSYPFTQLLHDNQLDIPSFLWIDVQGYEAYVFQGAAELQLQQIPVVSELWPEGIRHAGLDFATYANIIQGFWKFFWLKTAAGFERHFTTDIVSCLEDLDKHNRFTNVIFTNDPIPELVSGTVSE